MYISPLLRFSQRIHNEPHLGRGEASGRIREADGTEIVHQVRIIVDPQHQFLSRGSGSDIRAIELCQLSFPVSSYLHRFIHFIPVIQSVAKDLNAISDEQKYEKSR